MYKSFFFQIRVFKIVTIILQNCVYVKEKKQVQSEKVP